MDDASREQLELGQKVTELMKQKQYSPMSVSEMGLVLFAVDKGYLKDVELNKIADFESALLSYMSWRMSMEQVPMQVPAQAATRNERGKMSSLLQ